MLYGKIHAQLQNIFTGSSAAYEETMQYKRSCHSLND